MMYDILLIEDEKTIQRELKILLEKYGYHVTTTDDFENVVSFAFSKSPHLILLDLNLPVFDGYHICREIRKQSQTPIIVVTSRDSDIDELLSMNLGADDFITKPYHTQILLARIAAILNRTYHNESSNVISF
ncbi:MAG: response regulator [Clostridiales Family XIII bacterium]|jgi:DNA-binding response OmpR family regulator|nr:response regulator [Clostridiales Family XIII bacterium]